MSSLAVKFRPLKFEDVIGQDLVVKVLKNIAKSGVTHNAYLLTGPYGSGKTSISKVFASALNCLSEGEKPCGVCDNCRQIHVGDSSSFYLEIDAATFGNVENMRKIQQIVQFTPIGGKYIVILLDEAHQMSKEASNSLLKIVEDPPKHAIFIFVSTEREKIIETIRSRCINLRLRRVSVEEVANRLDFIAKQEGIEVTKDILIRIAELNDGIVRDSITTLEQLGLVSKKIDEATMSNYLNWTGVSFLDFTKTFISGDKIERAKVIEALLEANADLSIFCKFYLRYLRNLYLWRLGILSTLQTEIKEDYKSLDGVTERLLIDLMKNLISLSQRLFGERSFVAEDFRIVLLSM